MSSILSGQVVASGNNEYSQIAPNSRIHIQLNDVSLMDAPSVTLSEQIIHVGDGPFNFPVSFNLTYDSARIQSNMSYAVSVRISKGDDLAWISTSRHAVLTQGNPSSSVKVSVDNLARNGALPGLTKITGRIVASSSVPASYKIAPNSRISIQLLDVSLMDAPSVTLAEQKILTSHEQTRSFPISFSLSYDPSQIKATNSYAISVRVEERASDKLIWLSTSSHSVLTRGAPQDGIDVAVDYIQN